MCLRIEEWVGGLVDHQFSRGTLRAWKVYKRRRSLTSHRTRLLSSAMGHPVERNRDGFVISDRRALVRTVWEQHYKTIEHGIHVFLLREDALAEARLGKDMVVVPVSCFVTDLIAAGLANQIEPSAVFSQVHISDKAWRRALGKERK